MSARIVEGFDYRDQHGKGRVMREWNDEIAKVESTGGYAKRIGGDLTAFDKGGTMLFEIYDQDRKPLQ